MSPLTRSSYRTFCHHIWTSGTCTTHSLWTITTANSPHTYTGRVHAYSYTVVHVAGHPCGLMVHAPHSCSIRTRTAVAVVGCMYYICGCYYPAYGWCRVTISTMYTTRQTHTTAIAIVVLFRCAFPKTRYCDDEDDGGGGGRDCLAWAYCCYYTHATCSTTGLYVCRW